MGKLLRFLLLACVVQVAGAQGLFKGFVPDENGTNLDVPVQKQKLAPGTIIKDCPECPEMVVLPSDSFLMGSPPDPGPDPFSNEKPKIIGNADEKPQHRVQIQSFAIGKYEVTQEQWYAVMGYNPSENKGRALPVEKVSWDAIQQFIAKLNQKTRQKYRLPSEAEWEYAAAAGTTTEWSHGEDKTKLGHYAWYDKNSGGETHAVGQKLPNAFGIFDMYGNVSEWTQDCWQPVEGIAWTKGCRGDYRVLRGGSWYDNSAALRSAIRGSFESHYHNIFSGFRLARDL